MDKKKAIPIKSMTLHIYSYEKASNILNYYIYKNRQTRLSILINIIFDYLFFNISIQNLIRSDI